MIVVAFLLYFGGGPVIRAAQERVHQERVVTQKQIDISEKEISAQVMRMTELLTIPQKKWGNIEALAWDSDIQELRRSLYIQNAHLSWLGRTPIDRADWPAEIQLGLKTHF